ncbi:MAG: T9SS type A sorting domain-containing protein, partial [Ignavibacteriaceae bacterium]
MEKLRFLLLALILLISYSINAQHIHFTSPTNGLTVTGSGTGSTESSVPLHLTYYYQRSNNSNLIGMYIKLFPSPYANQQSNQGEGISQWWYIPAGTYTWRIELWEGDAITGSVKTAEQTITFNVKYNIQSLNNFGGGGINVDGQQRIHGYTTPKLTGEVLQVGAIDQIFNNTDYLWNQSGINNSIWKKKRMSQNQFFDLSGAISRNYSYTVSSNDNGAQIQAAMRKIVKPNFQNSFVSLGNGGVITVNNAQYNSPTAPFDVIELNPINAQAVGGLILNAIYYTFDHWSDGSTSANKTFNPSSTTTYTAYYKGKPSRYDLNLGYNLSLHTSTVVGEPITLYWNEHPNTYVTKYQIWRKEKYNGVTSDPHLLATVNRGTTSFTDDDFYYTTIKNQYMLYYDVRPYYIIENSYAEALWMPVFAEYPMYKTADSTLILSSGYDNFISNHPNPFNPITNISYSIKDAGLVNIRVFDVIGNEIATIVNEEKNPGKYEVTFDASALSSGVYLYTITSGSFMQT